MKMKTMWCGLPTFSGVDFVPGILEVYTTKTHLQWCITPTPPTKLMPSQTKLVWQYHICLDTCTNCILLICLPILTRPKQLVHPQIIVVQHICHCTPISPTWTCLTILAQLAMSVPVRCIHYWLWLRISIIHHVPQRGQEHQQRNLDSCRIFRLALASDMIGEFYFLVHGQWRPWDWAQYHQYDPACQNNAENNYWDLINNMTTCAHCIDDNCHLVMLVQWLWGHVEQLIHM